MPEYPRPRLIDATFPLKQISLDLAHEKSVRHGHPFALHAWPNRRPLAACRAAILAVLLPDPGATEARDELAEAFAGQVVQVTKRRRRTEGEPAPAKEETVGGVLRWGRPGEAELQQWRKTIRDAYGGKPPRVLDPFAGGGSIPLEASRLGCDVKALDVNPVAWFILKSLLEHPRRLAGQRLALPAFALDWPEFVSAFSGTHTEGDDTDREENRRRKGSRKSSLVDSRPRADFVWHVLAWGRWVLDRAAEELESRYPAVHGERPFAYLCSRTVTCKHCGSRIPLMRTRWLSKKGRERIELQFLSRRDRSGVDFAIVDRSQLEPDEEAGKGTVSRAGAWCPACGEPGTIAMTMEEIRAEGRAGRIGARMLAVVVDGPEGRGYRLPTREELRAAEGALPLLDVAFHGIPFGYPSEVVCGRYSHGFHTASFGLDRWSKLFTPRQLLAMGVFLRECRAAFSEMRSHDYPEEWVQALSFTLAAWIGKLAERNSTLVEWQPARAAIGSWRRSPFSMTWDFVEANPLAVGIARDALARLCDTIASNPVQPSWRAAEVALGDARVEPAGGSYDLVFTDPPHFDAVPFSDLADFYYVWLRRAIGDLSEETKAVFQNPLCPKAADGSGELLDDPTVVDGDKRKSRAVYLAGMAHALNLSWQRLKPDGRMILWLGTKQPALWETLVSEVVRAGFTVLASWPLPVELAGGRRLQASSSQASVMLVCARRAEEAGSCTSTGVSDAMRLVLAGEAEVGDGSAGKSRLAELWHAGLRGPHLVWAAMGTALEVYSRNREVVKAGSQDVPTEVPEYLREVRQIVARFVADRAFPAGNAVADRVLEIHGRVVPLQDELNSMLHSWKEAYIPDVVEPPQPSVQLVLELPPATAPPEVAKEGWPEGQIPWHRAVSLRNEWRVEVHAEGLFSAELGQIAMGRADALYQEPERFVSITVPTVRLRELCRLVFAKLSTGKGKSVHLLESGFGGKTHSLIALYHLASNPLKLLGMLPTDLLAGTEKEALPRVRVATVCLDPTGGDAPAEARGPDGEALSLRYPWSRLAYQLAGDEGLSVLQGVNIKGERRMVPGGRVLRRLVSMGADQEAATLVLVDWARLRGAAVEDGDSKEWARLLAFLKGLRRAVSGTARCCLVVSLPNPCAGVSGGVTRERLDELKRLFGGISARPFRTLSGNDLADVLRRRFFSPESLENRDLCNANSLQALERVMALDPVSRRRAKSERKRYAAVYPFHPALTDALERGWTKLAAFDRLGDLFRPLAAGLRDAERWDRSPLIGTNVLLGRPGDAELSEAAKLLAAGAVEEGDGSAKREWPDVLGDEMAKARAIQSRFPGLGGREIEQAVMGAFLHSQPPGESASTRDLLVLLGPTGARKGDLRKALLRWWEASWSLDEVEPALAGSVRR